LLEALTAFCDRVDAELETGKLRVRRPGALYQLKADSLELQNRVKARDSSIQRELEALRVEARKVPDLEAENEALKKQLALLDGTLRKTVNITVEGQSNSGSVSRASTTDVETSASPISAPHGRGHTLIPGPEDDSRSPGPAAGNRSLAASSSRDDEIIKLNNGFAKLAAKHDNLKTLYHDVVTLAKTQRKENAAWAKYALKCEKEIRRLQARQHVSRTPTPGLPSKLDAVQSNHGLPGFPFQSDEDPSTASAGDRAVLAEDAATVRAISALASAPEAHRRALSARQELTQGDEAYHHERPSVLPPEAACTEVKIKREPSSDGPVMVSERPVKRRKHDGDTSRRAKPEDTGSDPIVMGDFPRFDPQESMDLDEGHEHFKTPRKRRQSPTRREPDREATPSGGRSSPEHPHGEGLGPGASDKRRPLRPVSTNYRIARTKGIPESIQAVAKSYLGPQPAEDLLSLKEDRVREEPLTGSRQQLGLLLNQPSPGPGPILSRRLPRLRAQRFSPETDVPGEEMAAVAEPYDDVATRAQPLYSTSVRVARTPEQRQHQPRTTVTATATRSRPLDGISKTKLPRTPLREKPLSALRLDDFLINPKLNAGEKFAYTEVVRSKADRDELAGCIDPRCCGKDWRVLALSERNAVGPSYLFRPESIRLLENYLGDEAYRLATMTRKEKEDLWLEAKIRILADTYGKHRHRYHRQPSPPGFWDADFPSTQDQEEQRKEAARREKVLIQERYREATRKGGRWLFRDEQGP